MALLEELVAEPPPLRLTADGVIRVGPTRVSLDTVIGAFEDGATPEEIVIRYDSLHLGDVYSAIGYCLRHPVEVKEYLARRRERAEQVQKENEARWPTRGLRERLLARRQAGADAE